MKMKLNFQSSFKILTSPPEKAEAELRLLFAIMDAAGDGDGVLTLAELQSALRK